MSQALDDRGQGMNASQRQDCIGRNLVHILYPFVAPERVESLHPTRDSAEREQEHKRDHHDGSSGSTAAKKTRQARVIPNEFSLKLFACAIGPFRAAFRRLDLPADLNEFWF
jgi:hypothetical protein